MDQGRNPPYEQRDVGGEEGAADPQADNTMCPEGPPGGKGWISWCRARVETVGWGKVIAAGLIGALLVLLALPAVFGVNPYDLVRGKVRSTDQNQRVTVVSPSGGSADVSIVARNVTNSIVNIDIRSAPPQTTTAATPTVGSGSGVIYRSDGYIITNNHLVGGADSITVTMGDGKRYGGTLVGADPESDIAVVKIDVTGLDPVTIGDSDSLVVGELVVAIGSPLGFQQTVTSGIISALDRSVRAVTDLGQPVQLDGLIQTNAPINPGNSGGALCDSSAGLIGINAVIATQSGGSEGIAFAVPSNTAVRAAERIIAGGR
ncbi:MAG: trypsin-like peptidase domain-containing protein [Actinobacteria bacterium]|nr:trypsin-like peptidase domain-containing protein [Actinomycetota bacterium]MBU1943201.1 trypsin-like peptidase domain-containing protein [Actinomycetota bacterium]MBU2686240.1 trypsin-like peptidase domain-containing protein [Actinomycetota bacterium]